ncbi:MAG: DUF2034 domain-containing protein [Chloroflexi bacterium]|nr:DUF2034 domain-containing protein [Chloroflexota bacterium]
MIVRVEWQFSHPRRIMRLSSGGKQKLRQAKEAYVQGWIFIAGLTVLYAGWLIYRTAVQPNWLAGLSPELDELLGLMEAAGAFTLGFLWFSLWQRRRHRGKERPFSPMTRDQLYKLSPTEFERYVAHLFRQKGYRVALRGKKGDLGVDLELTQPGGKQAIVQCKRYQNKIEPKIARELFGTLMHERAAHAFLVTTAEISKATRQWAQHKPMTLIDGETLVQIAAALNDQ